MGKKIKNCLENEEFKYNCICHEATFNMKIQ